MNNVQKVLVVLVLMSASIVLGYKWAHGAEACKTTQVAIEAQIKEVGATKDVYEGSALTELTSAFGHPPEGTDTVIVTILPGQPVAIFVAIKQGCVLALGAYDAKQYLVYLEKHSAGGKNNG